MNQKIVQPKNKEDLRKVTKAAQETMNALADVMEQELAFIKSHDLKKIDTLRDEKEKLKRAYQEHVFTLRTNPQLLTILPDEERASLRKVGLHLAEVAKRNASGLRGAIEATRSVVKVIVDAAKDETKLTNCYGDPRKAFDTKGAYSPKSEPVAFNQMA